MINTQPHPGWLMRQARQIRRDVEQWPSWMKRIIGMPDIKPCKGQFGEPVECSREGLDNFDAFTGEEVSFVYPTGDERVEVRGHQPKAMARRIAESLTALDGRVPEELEGLLKAAYEEVDCCYRCGGKGEHLDARELEMVPCWECQKLKRALLAFAPFMFEEEKDKPPISASGGGEYPEGQGPFHDFIKRG